MAKAKGLSKFAFGLLAFIVGLVGSFYVVTYFTLPETESVNVTEEIYYSNSPDSSLGNDVDLSKVDAEISVHFLELGNKYTGDCTYIKTDECDILIDCGSKSNSIETVANYLNKYITDGTIEYVIVTHAHQDHYAGFATTEKVDSIFDLYECETIIDFAKTNQKDTAKVYSNYKRELADEVAKGAKHFTALECVEGSKSGASKSFDIGSGYTLNILDSKFYRESSDENNYSVCTLITNGTQNFLFTGDLESDGETELVKLNSLPKVDLYKAGHHGSGTSSTDDLLSIIEPKRVCVCCCAGSSEYTDDIAKQFPTQAFIDRVAPHTQKVYVTTMCVDYDKNEFTSFNGNIVYLVVEGVGNIACSNNSTYLKDTEWFKNNRQCPVSWQTA